MTMSLTTARPYAKAAFDYATEQAALAVWHEHLQLVAAIVSDKQIHRLFQNPLITTEQLVKIISTVAGDSLTTGMINFLSLLAKYHRLAVLPEIALLFAQYWAAQKNLLTVTVISAWPLSAAQQQQLQTALEKRLQSAVTLEQQIDRAILGGLVIRAGNLVIDGSVSTKLQRLKFALWA